MTKQEVTDLRREFTAYLRRAHKSACSAPKLLGDWEQGRALGALMCAPWEIIETFKGREAIRKWIFTWPGQYTITGREPEKGKA